MNTAKVIKTLALGACMVFGVGVAEAGYIRTQSTVEPGVWTSDYDGAMAKAEKEGIPLFVFWASPGCSHCEGLEKAMNDDEFVAWRTNRRILLVFSEGNKMIKSWIKSNARESIKSFPYAAVYWPRSGQTILEGFSAYKGKMSAYGANSHDSNVNQLMTALDFLLADWVPGETVDPVDPVNPEPPQPVDPDPPQPVGEFGPFYPAKAFNAVYPFTGAVVNPSELPIGIIQLKVGKPSKKGVSKVSGTIKTVDGKSYSIKAMDIKVDADASAIVRGITVPKLGTMDLEIGNEGFAAKISTPEADLVAATADLSLGLKPGTATFSVEGLPETISRNPVITKLLPVNEEITVTAKKWTVPGKATSVKYVKIPKTKPAEYELQIDDDKGKTNRSALKLTYTAKTASFKGSFTVYSDDGSKHKIIKNSFTVNGIVVNGVAVGIATCKKEKLSVPVIIGQ